MIEPSCSLYGDNFNVLKLEKLISFKISNKRIKGDIGKYGRYKGQPFPFDAGDIETPKKIPNEHRIDWLADFILLHKVSMINCGAENFVFHIDWYGVQGNMEFTTNQLSKISILNIPLSITYIQEEDY